MSLTVNDLLIKIGSQTMTIDQLQFTIATLRDELESIKEKEEHETPEGASSQESD